MKTPSTTEAPVIHPPHAVQNAGPEGVAEASSEEIIPSSDGPKSDINAAHVNRTSFHLAQRCEGEAEKPKFTPEEIIEKANEVAGKWAAQNGIRGSHLPPIEIDTEGVLPGIAAAGYGTNLDKILLNIKFIENNPSVLDNFIPHEEIHAKGARLRTRLKIWHPEIYEQVIRKHMLELTRNGEAGAIISSIILENPDDPKQSKRIIDCKYMEAPHLPANLRIKAVRLLEKFFNSHKDIFIKDEEAELPALTTNEKREITELLNDNDSKDFISQFTHYDHIDPEQNLELARQDAQDVLLQYFNSQILRTKIFFDTSAIPEDARRPEITDTPMNSEEIEEAKLYLRGYFSTIEGNAKVQFSQEGDLLFGPSDDEIFSYTLGAFEEREAEKNSSRYQLLETNEKLTDETSPVEKDKLTQQADAFKSDLALFELASQFVENQKQIASAPKNTDVLREVNREKIELRHCLNRKEQIESEMQRLSQERQHEAVKDEHGSTRELHEDESKLLFENLELNEKISDLQTKIKRERDPKEILDLSEKNKTENEALLASRERLLLAMQELAPSCTTVHLPPILFKSQDDLQRHAEKLLQKLGIDPGKVLGAVISDVIEKELPNAQHIPGVFGVKDA